MKTPSLRKQLKNAQDALTAFRANTKDLIYNLAYPKTRTIATVEVADSSGRLNGMTIAELLAIVNMATTSGEHIVIRSAATNTLLLSGTKKLELIAVKNDPPVDFRSE